MLNKSHPLSRYTKLKTKYLIHFHFDPAARVFALSDWAQDTTLRQFLFSTLYLFDCMILVKEFVSLTNVAMEMSKIHFFNDQWKIFQEEKSYLKTWILQMPSTTEKIELIGYLILDEQKLRNLKNIHLEKKTQ